MARILRSVFRYPTIVNPPIQKIPTGESQPVTFKSFSCDFNLVYDPNIGVIRPPLSLNEQTTLGIRTTTSYSTTNYFAGLSVNDIIVHDGIFKILDGVDVKFVNNGKSGIALIDIRKIDFGILDDIKIIAMKSDTYNPWLYYGTIPERAKLVYSDNRQIASSGAIYPIQDNDLIQAVGFRYFIDVSLESLYAPFILPFISAFFTPIYSMSGGVGTAFFVADAISGDGSIGYRTATNFKVISQGLGGQTFDIEAQLLNTIRTDNFRTVNYKQLEYSKNTYKINKIISEKDYYIIASQNKEVVDYINLVGNSFDIISNFINYDKTRMSFNSGDITKDQLILKTELIDFSINQNESISGNITIAEQVIKNNIVNNKTDNSIVALVISDLIPEINDASGTYISQLKLAVSQFTSQLSDVSLKLQLLITDTSKSAQTIALANEVFGSNNVIQIKDINLGWLNFLSVLAKSASITFDEDSLVIKQASVDVNSLRSGLSLGTSSTGISGKDYDRDGVISIIDSRLYEIITKYNPTQNFSTINSFLSDAGSEIRFWRKIIPMGNIYNFTGKIVNSSIIVGGNLLLDVDITWPTIEDPNNLGTQIPDPNKPTANIIKVLVERGASTNLEAIDATQDVIFQGRLFHPSYLIKTSINNVIKFSSTSDLNEISSWFRVFLTTARYILEFGNDPANGNEPLMIIRSNLAATDSSTANTSSISLSAIFGSNGGSIAGPESQYRIIEGAEEVGDYLNLAIDPRELTTEKTLNFNEKITIFNSKDDVILNNIEFDILIPKDSKPPSTSNTGTDGLIANFEYEILYQPTGFSTDDSTLTKFFSVIAFNGETKNDKIVFTIKYNPQNNQKFICQPTLQDSNLPATVQGTDNQAIPNPDKNKEFEITYPYGKKNDGSNFVWTWNVLEWQFNIKKNDTILQDSDYEISPDFTSGKFKLKTAINPQEDILVAEFINISGNQQKLKKGSKVSLRLKSGPQNVDKPTFSNSKINFETFNKAERVEAHYSSTAQGDSYYLIAPAFGFSSLSGAGWVFNQEAGTDLSGGSFSTRVIGNINGPILFVDAFAKNTKDKVISKVGGIEYSFPYIDIVHSNLVNTFGRPFMETLSILFDAPPPPNVERITSVRSPVSERLSVFYNSNNLLKQKYSFSNFNDRNTNYGWEDFVEESLRKNIPIYSDFVSIVDKTFDVVDDSIVFDVSNTNSTGVEAGDKILVAIGLESSVPDVDILPISTVKVYELAASIDGVNFGDFGYSDVSGHQTPLRLIYDKEILKQLPDTTGLKKIKIKPANIGDKVDIKSPIKAHYVSSLSAGRSPTIYETSYGEYILFFVQPVVNSPLQQIRALFSNHDAQEWIRPAVPTNIETTTIDKSGTSSTVLQRNQALENSVLLLSGYNNPMVIKSNISDTFYLFLYNARSAVGKIEMVEMQRALFLKLEQDNNSTATDVNAQTPDESQTSLTLTPEVKSYNRVFKQTDKGFNHVKAVLPNATQNFSVVLTKSGDLYLGVITADGQFRIKYNRASGSSDINTSFNWEDLGIDLFDTTTSNEDGTKGSFLSKVVTPSNISAITLSFSEIEDSLSIFIATSDNKLIFINIPESIIKPYNLKTQPNDSAKHTFLGEEKTDSEIDQYFQVSFNLIKPDIIYGKKEGLNPSFIETINATKDDFPPQIVSVEWLENGNGHFYFVDTNGRINGRITKTSGLFWENLLSI